MRACLDLLVKFNYIDAENKTLREVYESAIGVYNLEREDPKMWELLHKHKVESLFQMEQQSGIKGISLTNPSSVEDLATLNSAIRLMAQERGAEQPIEKFARFKKDINEWYKEMDRYGLTKKEQSILKEILEESSGLCIAQEQFMKLVQLPECGGFNLLWADRLRKAIAKKSSKDYDLLTEEFFKVTKEKNCSETFCKYVWFESIALSKGYGFNAAHTLAYSIVGLQELNLAYNYPIIFWDTANLIVDSGAMNLEETFNLNDEENENEKIENSSTDYGKISTTISKMKTKGIKFTFPDINKSDITFIPDLEKESIIYGLRGLNRIGNQLIKDIITHRPYSSIEDFMKKVKVNKLQLLSLIKGGAFDSLYDTMTREEILDNYLLSIADQKKRITLQNMMMLIKYNLLPEEFNEQVKVFNFNKYLKKHKSGEYYLLDNVSFPFFVERYSDSILENISVNNNSCSARVYQVRWDGIYSREMQPIRDWMKEYQDKILKRLNDTLFNLTKEKYGNGNISKWEMESLGFYYHDHELSKLKNSVYSISDYNRIPNEPVIEKSFPSKDGKTTINMYEIFRIAGTVIDKNKNKNMITLLTTTGTVTVKIWKSQFSEWDKQISERDLDGTKHVIEKSWFTRGTKLIISGIKKENTFVPKKYKSSEFPLFEKIVELDDKGFILKSETQRAEVMD